MTCIEPNYWLGKHLNKSAYRLVGPVSDLIISELPSENAFVEARVDTDDFEGLAFLQDHGFRVVDCSITLERSAGVGEPYKIHDYRSTNCRFAALDDDVDIKRLAFAAFKHNRFTRDVRIPNNVASKIKEAWAGNYFRGMRGDWMVVSESEGAINGFLQLLLGADGFVVIDLIAVEKRFHRAGVARSLISFALHNCLDFEPNLRVGTSLANDVSLKLYESLGFKLTNKAYLLHRHS